MTHQQPCWNGERFGFHYLFEAAGDGLPVHRHEAPLEHDVCCISGRVVVIGMGWSHILEPGWRLRFDSDDWHKVIALEAYSSIDNELRGGFPECYKGLPVEELKGSIEAGLELQL